MGGYGRRDRRETRSIELGELEAALRPCVAELLAAAKADAEGSNEDEKPLSPAHAVGRFNWCDFDRIASVGDLTDLIRDSKGFHRWQQKGEDSTEPERQAAVRLVMGFTGEVVSESSYSVREEVWQEWLEGLLHLLNEGARRASYWVPLLGVNEASALQMEGIEIRPLSDEDAEFIAKAQMSMPWHLTNGLTMVAEITLDLELGREAKATLLPIATALVHALRLFSGCQVVPLLYRYSCDFASMRSWGAVAESGPVGHKATLTAEFPPFWAKTKDVLLDPPKKLTLALHRFRLMQESPRSSERLLDQLILLEALLGEGRGALTRKLRQRTAHFMASDFATRKALSETIKVAYAARSKIAHGGELDRSSFG